jgi:hypothetical protein
MVVPTTAWTHPDHPYVAGSRILDKEVTGCFFSPYSWVRTPKTVPLSTLISRQKGFFREGRANTGVVTRECLSSSIIRISSDFQIKVSAPLLVIGSMFCSKSIGVYPKPTIPDQS